MNKLVIFAFILLVFSIPNVFAQTSQDHMGSNHTSMVKQMGKDHYLSPHKQMKQGVEPHMVQCREGFELYMKVHDYMPVCIKITSTDKLIARGWLLPHDMKHFDLNSGMNQTKMMGN